MSNDKSNPIEGVPVGKGEVKVNADYKRHYDITKVSEEELVEVISALRNWLDNAEDDMHEVHKQTFEEPDNMDVKEEYESLRYQVPVVRAFLEGLTKNSDDEIKEGLYL